MPRVRVLTSVRIAANRPVPRIGDVLDLTDDEYGRFKSLGVFQSLEDSEGTSSATDSPENGGDPTLFDEVPLTDSEAVTEDAQSKKPAKTAPADAWIKYANSLGHDVKGLSKKDIIALVQ